MANLYLDTEFNSFGGELISLALFNPHGESFYEVVRTVYPIAPWVSEHVIPFLGKESVPRSVFNRALRTYLAGLDLPISVVADWPADLEHFFASLMIEGHWEVDWPIEARLLHSGPLLSAVPHNALEDAMALARWHMLKQAADTA